MAENKKGESDITKHEFMEWTNGLWTFSGESKKRLVIQLLFLWNSPEDVLNFSASLVILYWIHLWEVEVL